MQRTTTCFLAVVASVLLLVDAAVADWPLFRGDAARSAQGPGESLLSKKTWQFSLVKAGKGEDDLEGRISPETQSWLERAFHFQSNKSNFILPGFYPVARAGKVFYRDYWGLHGIDLKTGNVTWHSTNLTASLDALVTTTEKRQEARQWFDAYIQGPQNIIFENSTIGTLSVDDNRVYAVDDLAIPPHPNSPRMQQMLWGDGKTQLPEFAIRGRLIAHALESGRLLWERGDPMHDASKLAGSYFLGPPLPLAGKLYLLTQQKAELKLICLEAAKGEVLWSETLQKRFDEYLLDPTKRVHAAHLAYAGGILVCPTNTGNVFGVDLETHRVVWTFGYKEKRKDSPVASPPELAAQERRMAVLGSDLSEVPNAWKLSCPVIQEGKVVFTAPDAQSIHCVGLRDGALLWRAQRKNDVYLAGVFGSSVLVVGREKCRALALSDGKDIWELPTAEPAGMGLASGNVYYLPLKKGEIWALDVQKGVVLSKTRMPARDAILGNLIFADGYVISQTIDTITCYPQAGRDGSKNSR
jgi:outer membrane protein assembly factor BamB